ncbi:MAG: OpgC domain-containing protein [Fibrobacter sp.]|nr:OpgC domain-containing protein [Fibrobacter sp.]
MAHSKRIQALDSIRGLLLLQMTLDHFSGPVSHVLYQCFGFFSAAEGFFFLSGFVGMLAVISKTARGEDSSWMRKRSVRIWKYHVVTVAFLATVAFFFLPKIKPFFSALYAHPFSGSVLIAILAYLPDWIDVLPLYCFLLLIGSFVFPWMAKGHLKISWGISFALWIASQWPLRATVLQMFPSWMNPGFFDIFAWQFVYFSGAACSAIWKKEGSPFAAPSKFLDKAFPVAAIFCATCFILSHQFLGNALPGEFWISKEHVGVLRFANFLAFVCVISFLVRRKPSLLDFKPCATLGRHSLEVYSSHIVILYLWMATPNAVQYHLPFNVIAPILCCVLLWVIAKIRD